MPTKFLTGWTPQGPWGRKTDMYTQVAVVFVLYFTFVAELYLIYILSPWSIIMLSWQTGLSYTGYLMVCNVM